MAVERSPLSAETLSRIMLLQGMIGQLPEEQSVFDFVCRGLEDLPGVRAVRHVGLAGAGRYTPANDEVVLPIEASRRCYGALVATLAAPSLFQPYEAFVRNLCFTVAVMLEERRQRAAIAAHQTDLERQVEERTRQLVEEVAVRQAAERRAVAEKENLAVTLRSIGDAVITTDTDGRIVLMNAVAERLTGYVQAEAAGQPLTDCFHIVHEHTRAACANPVAKVLASDQVVELANHTVLVARNGHEYAIADSGAPIRAGDGSVIGVVLVFRDMTEKYRMLEAVQRADRLQSLGVLAGGIAHDFNNLLGGVYGYIELAQMDTDDPAVRQNLAAAVASITKARGLTRQLLTFAKGGAPVKRVGPLAPVIQDAARFSLSGSKVRCHFELPDDLWNCAFDAAQIGQVIDNMVINAVQAMPDGGSLAIVASNAMLDAGAAPPLKAGPHVRVEIRDTGPGIPADVLHQIFDPFFTTKKTGTGLGLATTHSIVARHEGAILAESEPGQGTTFTIFLPAQPERVAEAAAAEPAEHRGYGTILVMDDDQAVLDITTRLLASMGYASVTARDGREAIALVLARSDGGRRLRAAMLDLTIPGGMGGKEAAAVLRRHCPTLPIFVVSGYAHDPVMASPHEQGFTDSLCKPFTRGDLAALLERHPPVTE